jgi:uncharacterized membrane protein YeaQ/YmgE (transglycosylase-associated protein family)
MVLFYWAGIGLVVGILAHLLLRSRGEAGFNVFGEALLGALGSLVLAMLVGVVTGLRRVDVTSGLIALVGAVAVLSVVVIATLRTSPVRAEEARRSS